MKQQNKLIQLTCLFIVGIFMFYVVYIAKPIRIQFKLNIRYNDKVTPENKATEKYITFIPHSGLNNQRIAIINGLLLAKALNRTLILPKINIGSAVPWRPTPLSEHLLDECDSIQSRSISLCRAFKRYVPVSVESIFDLSPAHTVRIRTLQRNDMSKRYFEDKLGIVDPDLQILRIRDDAQMSYRIYDTKTNTEPKGMFKSRINLEELKEADEDVILFGSLHYTQRLVFEQEDLIWLKNHFEEGIHISHPVVMKQALRTLSLLGGPSKFIAAHLRQGDGFFMKQKDQLLNQLKEKLEQPSLGKSGNKINRLLKNKKQTMTPQDQEKLDSLRKIKDKNSSLDLLTACHRSQTPDNHPRLRLIYIATDSREPRFTLKPLYDEFPCIFTLSDFPEIIQETLNMAPMITGAETIDQEMIQYGTTINSLLLPMIDAEISSHGSTFIGTQRSTYSQYIKYRHQRYQKLFH